MRSLRNVARHLSNFNSWSRFEWDRNLNRLNISIHLFTCYVRAFIVLRLSKSAFVYDDFAERKRRPVFCAQGDGSHLD